MLNSFKFFDFVSVFGVLVFQYIYLILMHTFEMNMSQLILI